MTHDVYASFYDKFGLRVFANIAKSQSKRRKAVLWLINSDRFWKTFRFISHLCRKAFITLVQTSGCATNKQRHKFVNLRYFVDYHNPCALIIKGTNMTGILSANHSIGKSVNYALCILNYQLILFQPPRFPIKVKYILQ